MSSVFDVHRLLPRVHNIEGFIMNHDSGFIIGITDIFAKILIEHTPKTCLKKHPQTKNNLLMVLCK